jgi:hypothetical protein
MSVKFEELKTGDKIARRFKRLEGDRLVTDHYQPHKVLFVTGQANKMVHLKADITGDQYVIHEGLHTSINDELRTWDRV